MTTLPWNRTIVLVVERVNPPRGVDVPRQDRSELRKIHIDLPAEIHKKLRVKAAWEDKSLQAFVCELVADAVRGVRLPKTTRGRRKKSK